MIRLPSLALSLGLALGACTQTKDTTPPGADPVSCTEEAKVCEDGSAVARQGPDCEFAACPGEDGASTSDEADDPVTESAKAEPTKPE